LNTRIEMDPMVYTVAEEPSRLRSINRDASREAIVNDEEQLRYPTDPGRDPRIDEPAIIPPPIEEDAMIARELQLQAINREMRSQTAAEMRSSAIEDPSAPNAAQWDPYAERAGEIATQWDQAAIRSIAEGGAIDPSAVMPVDPSARMPPVDPSARDEMPPPEEMQGGSALHREAQIWIDQALKLMQQGKPRPPVPAHLVEAIRALDPGFLMTPAQEARAWLDETNGGQAPIPGHLEAVLRRIAPHLFAKAPPAPTPRPPPAPFPPTAPTRPAPPPTPIERPTYQTVPPLSQKITQESIQRDYLQTYAPTKPLVTDPAYQQVPASGLRPVVAPTKQESSSGGIVVAGLGLLAVLGLKLLK
jgi:hypothetical protein